MALSTRLLTLRRSPVLLKLPPYLSALCIAVGIAWILLLPLDGYSRQTYVSENAILPGQVHTYFGGSEHNVFRAFRQEVYAISVRRDPQEVTKGLVRMIQEIGLEPATQQYKFEVAGEEISGTNVYGLLRGPRADATEAMVLIAAWRNFDGQMNWSGVALALSIARYFKRWSIWSKDIILLIPEDSTFGPEAWVSAYHSTSTIPTSSRNISALPIKAGALQGALALDYPVGPWGQRFGSLDVLYDGINGALPNLDLLNTVVSIAGGQHGVGCSLHKLDEHSDGYQDRLGCLAKGIMKQAAGHATGPHSAFMPYHVDAITIKTVGEGWHDEMTLGRVTESVFRSLNNLLEHLHQSFFFYLLMNTHCFVSIGSYLPAAMLVAGSFTINALALWVLSGRHSAETVEKSVSKVTDVVRAKELVTIKEGNDVAFVPKIELETVERKMFLPAIAVLTVHLASSIPLYFLTHLNRTTLAYAFYALILATLLLPPTLSVMLTKTFRASVQQIQVMQSLSLLFLGATLSTWATINFSLALLVGLMASPLSFVRPLPIRSILSRSQPQDREKTQPRKATLIKISVLIALVYVALSPPIVLSALSWYWDQSISWMLFEIAKGWTAQGVWTNLILWSVWWPAWVLGGVVLLSELVR